MRKYLSASLVLTLFTGTVFANNEPHECAWLPNTHAIVDCHEEYTAAISEEIEAIIEKYVTEAVKNSYRENLSDEIKKSFPWYIKNLMVSQVHWSDYVTGFCSARASIISDGTITRVLHASCVREHHELRLKELKTLQKGLGS